MKTKKLIRKKKSKEEPKKKILKKKKGPEKSNTKLHELFPSSEHELKIVSVFEDLPPNTNDTVIYFDKNYGWEIGYAKTVKEHIIYDHSHGYGYRVVLWALIPEMKKIMEEL